MTRENEARLFADLCRSRPLKEWLDAQLAEQVKILLVNPDFDNLRKAQGAAQFIKSIMDKLTAAESAAQRQ